MPSRLVSFINVLRSHDLRISPAETLDAVQVITTLGYSDRLTLRAGLSLALAKTPDEKATFLRCFDQFFSYRMPQAVSQNQNAPEEGAPPPDIDPALIDEAEAALERMAPGDGRATLDLASEIEKDPALEGQLNTPLMQMLRSDDRNGLALSIARAGDAVGLPDIEMFTQKGQFTRRILDELGEAHIRSAIVDLEARNPAAM